uniref:Neuropeptide n=1 Tax=Syphacia muris TaxID=451379 RepID=A0A0N5ANI0_9BILA
MGWFVLLAFMCILFQDSGCTRLKRDLWGQDYDVPELARSRLRRQLYNPLDDLEGLGGQGKALEKRRKFEFIRFGR